MRRWVWNALGTVVGVAVMIFAAEWSLRYESVRRRLVPIAGWEKAEW